MQTKEEESDANGVTEPEEALPAAVPAPEEVKEEAAAPKRAQRARGRGRNARL